MISLSCHACGGPLDLTLDQPCPCCGTEVDLDPTLEQRLRAHAARVAAAWLDLRVLIRYRLMVTPAQGMSGLRTLGVALLSLVPVALPRLPSSS